MKKLRDLWIVFSECGGPYPTAEYSMRTREGARRLKRDCDRRFPQHRHYVQRYRPAPSRDNRHLNLTLKESV